MEKREKEDREIARLLRAIKIETPSIRVKLHKYFNTYRLELEDYYSSSVFTEERTYLYLKERETAVYSTETAEIEREESSLSETLIADLRLILETAREDEEEKQKRLREA